MKIQKLLLFTVALSITASGLADPPKLLTTSPAFWAVGVNATTQKTASLTFDQPMRSGFWDWFGRNVLSPNSNLHSVMAPDGVTLSVDVQLQPGKVYVMGLNEKGLPGVGFQNAKGFTLPPTFLVFQTAGTPSADDVPPRVISTNPTNGAQAVDSAKVKSVTVSFDRAMQSSKHGLHMRENGKEVDLAKAHFQYSPDGKSFTLAYDFKPSSKYEFVLNSVQDIGFATVKRIPLWPVQFAFTTA